MIGLPENIRDRKSVFDVLGERGAQVTRGWDERNRGLSLDEMLGVTITYIGQATCSYRNQASRKRENIVKAAAVLLQILDRFDDGSYDPFEMNQPGAQPVRFTSRTLDRDIREALMHKAQKP